MTLQTFIHDTLPGLAHIMQQPGCDHILVSSQGTWSARCNGAWQVQSDTLDADTLAILVQMCEETPDANLAPPFHLHILHHPDRTTIALVRQSRRLPVTLPESVLDLLDSALQQGANGVILGPSTASKEGILRALAARYDSTALYISARQDLELPAHILTVTPPHALTSTRHLRASMRAIEAAFFEGLHTSGAVNLLWSHPGCQRRWGTLDASEPEAAFETLAQHDVLVPARTITSLVWAEPYYHGDIPPVVLERGEQGWHTSSTSALANMLVELANRYLPSTTRQPQQLPIQPPLAAATELDTSSLSLSLADSEPASAESDVDRAGFSALLQTHVTPDNHLLSTHPGFGSRSIQEDSDAGIVLPGLSSPQATEPPATDDLDEPLVSLDDMSEDPVSFEVLEDSEPEIIAEAPAEVAYDAFELPHDPLAVTSTLPPESDAAPTVTTLDELAVDMAEYESADQTMPINRDAIAEQFGDLMQPFDDDDEDPTSLVPAPYEELKRMERELMTASHDEPTGIHPDFLDAPPASPRPASEDDISTSVKGTTDMTLPDDPEVFSSLNAPEQAPRQAPPSAPEGVWQPAVADEPTQITFEHTNFASEAPNLSWGEDENTIQRDQKSVATPASSQPPPATDTSSKLSTLSDRIKALREKQRLSGQFDALPQNNDS